MPTLAYVGRVLALFGAPAVVLVSHRAGRDEGAALPRELLWVLATFVLLVAARTDPAWRPHLLFRTPS